MAQNKFGVTAGLVGLVAAAAVAAAPGAGATSVDPTTVAASPGSRPEAVTLPSIDGADPLTPVGTDPYVPYGVWDQ
jgi:hypothetical protein